MSQLSTRSQKADLMDANSQLSALQAFRRDPISELRRDSLLLDVFREGTREATSLRDARSFLHEVHDRLRDNGVEVFAFVIGPVTTKGNPITGEPPKPGIDYIPRNYDRLFEATRLALPFLREKYPEKEIFTVSTTTLIGKITDPTSSERRIVAEFVRQGVSPEGVQEEFKFHCREIVRDIATDLVPVFKHWKSRGTIDEMETGKKHGKIIHKDAYYDPRIEEIARTIRGTN